MPATAVKHLASAQLVTLLRKREISLPARSAAGVYQHAELVAACISAGISELQPGELAVLTPSSPNSSKRPVFRNGDTVRVADGDAVHLKSNIRAKLLPPEDGGAPPPSGVLRCSLKGLAERAGELIDLKLNGEPPVPGAVFRNPLAGDPMNVLRALARLPTGTDAAARAARRKLFAEIDGNGNGYLSLAEVDRGIRAGVLETRELADSKAAVMRAFQAAKGAGVSRSALSDDCVEAGEEFRLLLLYLRQVRGSHAYTYACVCPRGLALQMHARSTSRCTRCSRRSTRPATGGWTTPSLKPRCPSWASGVGSPSLHNYHY